VTPDELALIDDAASVVEATPDRFAATFYDTLFELAPGTRGLFPDDLAEQKGKLVDELAFLIGAARDLDTFVARASDLGHRHVGYGVRNDDYGPVGIALAVALRECMQDDWTPAHEAAWSKLYSLIAGVMRDGASTASFARH
jgi:hemoglobin-like flavoprotein